LSIPVIAMAAAYELWTLMVQPTSVEWSSLAGGLVVSFLSAYLSIRWFLALLEKIGMLPFVIYRLLLATVILVVFWPA